MAWRVVALLLLGTLTSQLALAQFCEEVVLQQLGWQASDAANAAGNLHATTVCDADTLHQAQQHAWLRYPSAWQKRPESLQDALWSQASRCAFQFKVSDAVMQASMRLSLNAGFRFTALQRGWVSFSAPAAQHWQATKSFGRRYQPKTTNSQAISVFYKDKVRTECGTGRQVAQLAMLHHLFGDEGFNHAFSAEELSIGTFVSLHQTDSVLQGRHQGVLWADGLGERTALLGRQAWLGMPGMIVHVFDAAFLDDINNQAENFVVVAVSAQAQAQLASAQGLAAFNRDNVQLWRWSQQINQVGVRYFERLLIENDETLWQALPQSQRAVAKQMQRLLQQPFYQQFLIYVHPLGIRSVGFHMARLLDRNSRTPFAIELALSNVSTEMYQRWVHEQLRQCQQTQSKAS